MISIVRTTQSRESNTLVCSFSRKKNTLLNTTLLLVILLLPSPNIHYCTLTPTSNSTPACCHKIVSKGNHFLSFNNSLPLGKSKPSRKSKPGSQNSKVDEYWLPEDQKLLQNRIQFSIKNRHGRLLSIWLSFEIT